MKKRSTRTESHPKRVQPLSKSQSQTFPILKHEFHNQRKLTTCRSNLYDQLSSVFNVLLPANLTESRNTAKKANASGDFNVKKKSRQKVFDELKANNALTLFRKMGDEAEVAPEEGGDAAAPEEAGNAEAPEATDEGAVEAVGVAAAPAEDGAPPPTPPPPPPPPPPKDAGVAVKERQGSAGSTISNFPLVDSAVLEELRNADAKAAKTSKLIESMKQDIMKLQQKKDMTEEDLKNLRTMHDALNAKLSEFEQIAKNIQQLLGIAELSPSKFDIALATPSAERPPSKKDKSEPEVSGKIPSDKKVEGKKEQVHLTSSEEVKLKELEDKLPKVIICGTGKEGDVPKIIVCEPVKGPEMTRSLAEKLNESYDMQEKLVNDNAKMEGNRYELQEELLSRDKAVESLQKQVESLRKEMKLIAKENAELQKKLTCQGPCSPCMKFPGSSPNWDTSGVSNKDMEKRIKEMEDAVRNVKTEIGCVQTERKMLKTQTQMLQCAFSHQPVCQKELAKQHQQGIETNPCTKEIEGQLRELCERYKTLDENFNEKIAEIACLRTELKNERIEIENIAERCCFAEARADDLIERLRMVEIEKQNACIARDQFIDMEQQLIIAKQQLQKIKEEKETLEIIQMEQSSQIEDYKNKYLDAQQTVEEQRRSVERLQVQSCEVKEKLLLELQQFKNQINEKLIELAPLPEKLRTCETKLVFSQQNIDELAKELMESKEMNEKLLAPTSDDLQKEKEQLLEELGNRDMKIDELKSDNINLKATLTRYEELTEKADWDYEEKLNEVTQLTTQLATVREEAARQVVKTKERCETVRKLMLGQISTLEKQLAESRAASNAASRERDEIRTKMQQQVSNLGDNFNQAQMRIRTLQDHINYLKASPTF